MQPCFAALAQEQFLLISCAQDGSSTVQAIFAQAAEKLAPAKHIVFHGAQAQAAAAFDSEIAALMPEMQKRKDASAGSTDWPWILICIDDLKRCIDSINDQTLRRLASILVLGKGLRVAVIVSGNAADITKLSASGERFTMEMTGKTTLLLGGSAQAHMFARTDLASVSYTHLIRRRGHMCKNGLLFAAKRLQLTDLLLQIRAVCIQPQLLLGTVLVRFTPVAEDRYHHADDGRGGIDPPLPG